MLNRVFLAHPREQGETYGEHFRVASGFAGELIAAGFACAVHAVVPSLFKCTGSRAIARLHDRLVVNRRAAGSRTSSAPAGPGPGSTTISVGGAKPHSTLTAL